MAGPSGDWADMEGDMIPLQPRQRGINPDDSWKIPRGRGRGWGRPGPRNHFHPYPQRHAPPPSFQSPPPHFQPRPPHFQGRGSGDGWMSRETGQGGWFPADRRGGGGGGRGGGRGRGGRGSRGRGGGGVGGEEVFRAGEYWDRRAMENPWQRLEEAFYAERQREPPRQEKNPEEIELGEEEEEEDGTPATTKQQLPHPEGDKN